MKNIKDFSFRGLRVLPPWLELKKMEETIWALGDVYLEMCGYKKIVEMVLTTALDLVEKEPRLEICSL